MYVYLHIPFCLHICSYCDFPKMLYDKKIVKKYLSCLEDEIKKRYLGEEVVSIYIGGGTPSVLDLEVLEYLFRLTKLFHLSSKVEFTVESNIESLDREKIKLFSLYGVNRVSLGVQSFHEETLTVLGRKHNQKMVEEVVQNLKDEGIFNLSIDYIYGVNSDIHEVEEDIASFLKLDIPHFSAYSLIIEDHTLFGICKRDYIDDTVEVEMYKKICKLLTEHGYHHYEISNYALSGYESIHNLNYWNNGSYYGFGLGAVSYLSFKRMSNTKNMHKYSEGEYIADIIREDIQTRISNEFILGLRKIEGIDTKAFFQKYQMDILKIDGVRKLILEGKLVYLNHHLFIKEKYLYLSNEILLYFV